MMKDYTQLSMYDDLNKNTYSMEDLIDHLGLSMQTYNSLRRAGISTIGQLKELVDSGTLITINGIGDSSVLDVKRALSVVVFSKTQPELTTAKKGKAKPSQPKQLQSIQTQQNSISEAEKIIRAQKLTIEKFITAGLLHPKAQVMGISLGQWLLESDIAPSSRMHEILSIVLYSSINITEELIYLLKGVPNSHIKILVTRYGASNLTLQEIGVELQITRERVRQIGDKLEEKIKDRIRQGLDWAMSPNTIAMTEVRPIFLKMQTTLKIAEDMGDNITYENWAQVLNESGLIGKWSDCNLGDYAPIDILVGIFKLLEKLEINELQIPKNLLNAMELAFEGTPDLPAKILHVRQTLPPKLDKIIRRHINFSGGVHVRWLSREVSKEYAYLVDVMQALGYQQLSEDWFIPRMKTSSYRIHSQHVFHHALRKMSFYCGPLTIDDLCSGIRHAISRESFPVPPPDVLKQMLDIYEYKNEDELYYWDGEFDEPLSAGEKILLDCITQNGPVVHHAQLAQAIIDSDLSFASLHGTLNRTPLIKRFDTALYKIRGKSVTTEDIERAQNTGERIPADVDVQFDRYGRIKVYATLGTLVMGTGVLFSEQLPNLSGNWFSYVGEQKFGNFVATEREFRNLVEPLTFLRCQGGDRIQFTFNTENRTVTIAKVNNDH